MDAPLPPLQRPDISPRPRGSCLVVVGAVVGVACFGLAFSLLIGFLWPVAIAGALLAVIGLQYLIWGWLFERIYRAGPLENQDSADKPLT